MSEVYLCTDRLTLRRIRHADVDNLTCGLRYVHTFYAQFDDPLPGTEDGEVLYEITRDEWAGRHGP